MKTLLSRWFGSPRHTVRTQPKQSRRRLLLETLEDRCTPSASFTAALGSGGSGYDAAQDLAADANGNTYMTGSLKNDGLSNAFVTKRDPNGVVMWTWSQIGVGEGWAVAFDAAGNAYATGYFDGSADFDPLVVHPGNGDLLNPTDTSPDVFVLKLNSDGSFAWVRSLGGAGQQIGEGIAVDGSGNVYVSTGAGQLAKYDTLGNQTWLRQFAASFGGVALDGSDNVHATGGFTGKVDFDPGPGVVTLASGGRNNNGTSAFVLKLTTAGNFTWAKNFKVTAAFGGCNGNDIAVDASGNVYTTGEGSTGTVDFDPGNGTYKFAGHFVSKLDIGGNFVWAKQLGGHGTDLTLDSVGNVYVAGHFQGTADFDPGAGTFQMTSTVGGVWDGFVTKLDTSGNFVWAVRMGGTGDDRCNGIAVDSAGHVYLSGSFELTADFGTLILTSQGNEDIFWAKLS